MTSNSNQEQEVVELFPVSDLDKMVDEMYAKSISTKSPSLSEMLSQRK